MNDNRPSKKQRELLSFIDGFIKGNGYGPSYREIMRALDYKSVSTVAVHVDGLVVRGLLAKQENSARSLEVVAVRTPPDASDSSHRLWLQKQVDKRIKSLKVQENSAVRRELATLIAAAKILGVNVTDDSKV